MNKYVLPFNEVISASNCVILNVLKEAMAIAMIEMPCAMKCFGYLGIEICVNGGSALMISQKSSRLASIIIRLTYVVDLSSGLNGYSCLARSRSQVAVMTLFVSKSCVKLYGTLNGTARLWLVPLIVCRWQHVQGKQIKFSDASKSKQNQNKIKTKQLFFYKIVNYEEQNGKQVILMFYFDLSFCVEQKICCLPCKW